jgi:hypothetical protein
LDWIGLEQSQFDSALRHDKNKEIFMPLKKLVVFAISTLPLYLSPTVSAEDDWHFAARINGWLPDTEGETSFTGSDFKINLEDVLDKLEFGFMGTLEARKGKWGAFSDITYASLGDSNSNLREATIGNREIPAEATASVKVDVESLIVSSAAFYRVIDDGMTLDVLFGARYFDMEQTMDWDVSGDISGLPLSDAQGGGKVEIDKWDALVGVRGRIPLGNSAWMIPYYLDVGTGNSDFTWQAATGIAYNMDGWAAGLTWRHMSYDLPSDSAVADMALTGPAMVFEFAW